MEFIKELGTLALGSRIKNLSESMMKDMARIYKEQNIDFEPRWFTFFQLILLKKKLNVNQIARDLNQTHPAIVQIINIMEKKKIIVTKKDKTDNRKRLVRLSKKGKQLAQELTPLWEIVQTVSNEVINENAPYFLDDISKIEESLAQRSTYQRIKEKTIQMAIKQ